VKYRTGLVRYQSMRIKTFALVLATLLLAHTIGAEALAPTWLIDIDGQRHVIGDDKARATVVLLLGTQCPISNRYIPQINGLAKSHSDDRVEFFVVVSDPTISRKDVLTYRDQYKIALPVIFDASGTLAAQLKPTHTPEAFLLDHDGTLRYRGRIDDGFAALG